MSDLAHLSDDELMRQLGAAPAPAPTADLAQMSDADLMAALGQPAPSGAREAANVVSGGIIEGIPVVGPVLRDGVDRASALARSVAGGKGYAEELEGIRSHNKQAKAEHPVLDTGAQIAGGIYGTLPLVAAAPAAFGAGTAALPARMLASGLSGGALGGADAAVRSGGDAGDIALGAGLGGGLGFAGPMVGAGAGRVAGAVASRIRPAEAAPTVAELRDAAHAAYQRADEAGVRLAQPSFAGAVNDIGQAAREAGLDRTIHPDATAALGRLEEAAGTAPSLRDVETLRRVVGGAAGSIKPDERRIASGMIDRLDDYVGGLGAADVAAGNPETAAAALREGRDLWSRSRRADMVEEAVGRAERRAASSGTGGNEDNAIRQNVRAILDNPKKVRGFSAEERQAMEDVVRGTPSQNALRLMGRLSPTSGTIPALAALGAAAVEPTTAAVAVGGLAAKKVADRLTARNVDRLVELIASGGQVPQSPLRRPATEAMQELTRVLATPAPVYANQWRTGQ